MQQFEDIKSIWLSEKAIVLPSVDELTIAIKKYQKQRQKIAGILLTVLALCLIGYIVLWFGYKTNSWTVRVGEVLMFTATIYSISYSYADAKKKKQAELLDSGRFLQSLRYELTEKSTEKKRIIIFLTILCFAYGFFFYDRASVNLNSIVVWYGSLLLAICFFGFIFWPIVMRMQQKSVVTMIEKIEKIELNLTEE